MMKRMFYDRVRDDRVVCLHVAFREQGEEQQEAREHLRMWVSMTVAKDNRERRFGRNNRPQGLK